MLRQLLRERLPLTHVLRCSASKLQRSMTTQHPCCIAASAAARHLGRDPSASCEMRWKSGRRRAASVDLPLPGAPTRTSTSCSGGGRQAAPAADARASMGGRTLDVLHFRGIGMRFICANSPSNLMIVCPRPIAVAASAAAAAAATQGRAKWQALQGDLMDWSIPKSSTKLA